MTITRRNLVKASMVTGLAATAAPWSPLFAQASSLNMTTIPSSGQQLPSIGIGCRNYRGPENPQAPGNIVFAI